MINDCNIISNSKYNMQSHKQNSNLISIALDKEAFFPGETVTGTIILEPHQPGVFNKIIIQFNQLKGCIMDLSNKAAANRLITSKLYEGTVYLDNDRYQKTANSQLIGLPPSTCLFPFSIPLDNGLPHSFDILIKPKAYAIRYVISVELSATYEFPKATKNIIIKSRPKSLPDPLYLASCANVKAWGLADQGTTIMTLLCPQHYYQYLDSVSFTVTIYNTRGKLAVEGIKVELLRDVKIYNAANEKVHDSIKEISNSKFDFTCLSNEKKSQLIEMRIEDSEVTSFRLKYPETKNSAFLIGTIDDSIIKCSYYLKVVCNFTTLVTDSSKPIIIAPIYITGSNVVHEKVSDRRSNNKSKEKEEIEEAIKQSQIEYEKEKEKNKIRINNGIEDEMYLIEQIKKIDAICRSKDIERNADASNEHNDNSHNAFIKNDVPLIYERIDDSNAAKKYNFFDKSKEEANDKAKEEETQQVGMKLNNDVFIHNKSIFNECDKLEEKLIDYPDENTNKKLEIFDINAL